MIVYTPGVPSQDRNPQSIDFLLLDSFTLAFLASAAEPLRIANQLSGRELCHWHTLGLGGHQVWASNGLQITPDADTDNVLAVDCVIVCGSVGIQRSVTHEHVTFLQAQVHQDRHLGAARTGSWALARASLLDGYDCNVHWEYLAAAQEALSWVAMSTRLFSIDRGRFTSPGGIAPMDMMLHLTGREHDRELPTAIFETFIYECIRNERDHQRVPLKHMLGTNQPKLQEIVALMETNLEEPIDLDELTVHVNVSRCQFERLFREYLHYSPSRHYLKLYLIRVRQLLERTSMSIIEVTSICGFVSTLHFSKCCREYFGIPPRDGRRDQLLGQPVVLTPIPQDLALVPSSPALSALSQTQGESTSANVQI